MRKAIGNGRKNPVEIKIKLEATQEQINTTKMPSKKEKVKIRNILSRKSVIQETGTNIEDRQRRSNI